MIPATTRTNRRRGLFVPIVFAIAVLLPTNVGAQSEIDDPALLESGGAIYAEACAGCHGDDGAGTDFGRPLIGIADQEPDRAVHIASVTDGKGGMPAFGDALGEDEIDAAVAYVRLTFVAERAVDELPRTGTSPVVMMLAGGLILVGVFMTEAARRSRRPMTTGA